MVIVQAPDQLPEDLLTDVKNATDILLYAQYDDHLQCSLEALRSCKALTIALINRTLLDVLPHLRSNEGAFNYSIRYDGPDYDSMDCGNIKWVQNEKLVDEKSEVLIPATHRAITAVLDQVLPLVQRRDRFFLSAQNEELTIQVAMLREKYGLPLGHRTKTAEFFVSKVAQKKFFATHLVSMAKTDVVSTNGLRKMNEEQLIDYLSRPATPDLPIFIKPVAAAGAYETFLATTTSEFVNWVKMSESYTYPDFLLQEQLRPPQYMAILMATPEGVKVPAISRSVTPFSNFVQRGAIIRETHMRREDSEFKEVADFSKNVFEIISNSVFCGGEKERYGCYFVDSMRRADGSLAVMEVQARYPAGFFVTPIAEDMYGVDVESYAVAWPFLDFEEHPGRARYHDACCLIYPAEGGRCVENRKPDPAWFQPGTRLRYITHMFQPGDQIPPKPLSIDYMVCELAITGGDAVSVGKSADSVMTSFVPVVLNN